MAVPYTSLAGSPKIKMDRNGGSATEILRVEWNQIAALMVERLNQFPYAFPLIPWLYAATLEIEPMHPEGIDPNGHAPPTYTEAGAKVTINYEVPKQDQQQQPTSKGGDGTGPGGKDGSTGGQEVTFIKHSLSAGGEFIQWPTKGLHWEINDLKGESKLADNTLIGSVIGLVEHQVTWSFVPAPPWDAIRSLIGTINDSKFCGALPGTLLFLGVEAERDITAFGAKTWNITYKFSEKRNKDSVGIIRGWNYFLRPSTGDWEKILRKPVGGEGVYREGGFAALFPT